MRRRRPIPPSPLPQRDGVDPVRVRLPAGEQWATVREHLEAIPRVCAGGAGAGPLGQLPQKERWHWLVAPRSTMIQTSPVHSGLCEDPARALEQLMDRMVRLPRAAGQGNTPG